MDAITTPGTWVLASPVRGPSIGQRIIGLLLGAGFTFGLFLGIAHFERTAEAAPPRELDDLRIATVHFEPPPKTAAPVESSAQANPQPGFDLAPAESPIKVAVGIPDFSTLLPDDRSKAPTAPAVLAPRLGEFKPKSELQFDAQHIYQKSEVDRPPTVLDRPTPSISDRVREGAASLRVTLILVIDAKGVPGHIRLTKSSGNSKFDSLMLQSIEQWVFLPALKGGKKVRCMIEQGITVNWSESGSPFEM